MSCCFQSAQELISKRKGKKRAKRLIVLYAPGEVKAAAASARLTRVIGVMRERLL